MAAGIKLLEAVKACEEAKSDFRAEAAVNAALEEADNLPAFDDALVAEGKARFEKLGLSSEGILVPLDAQTTEVR